MSFPTTRVYPGMSTMTETTQVTAAEATSDRNTDYSVLRWLVLATFIVILNETIMINAIPRLMVQFEVSARSAQWLSTSFMLTMAVVIPVTGWFLQRVTTRAAFATAMLVFCAGTLLAALAPVFPVLLAARVVQATGTAVMMPLLMTTLMTVVPEHDRGRVMGNVTLAMSVAPALGPAVSGVVLEWLSWRWIFGIVLPIARWSRSSGCVGSPTTAPSSRGPSTGSASSRPRSGSVAWSTGSASSARATAPRCHRRP